MAAALNKHRDFCDNPRDQRSVRERFQRLLQDFTSTVNKEEKASGINPADPSEAEQILEEIKEIIDSNIPALNPAQEKAESDRKKALNIRDQAMKTWGKGEVSEEEETEEKQRRKRSRRSTADPLEYLAAKREDEIHLRKEEMQLRKDQLEIERKRLDKEERRQSQMQEQMLLQNQQMQQQMQMMMALIQQNMNKH